MLTWIINLVKWNAGHTKYKFDENALGGHKVMNNALLAKKNTYDEYGNSLDSYEEEPKPNAFGLMLTNPNTFAHNQVQAGLASGTKDMKARKFAKPGAYLQSKQMVFGFNQKLLPDSRVKNSGFQ